MTIQRPDGQPIRVKYERHVVQPDGKWTWIGRTTGKEGGSVLLTFGEKAVFGTIADRTGLPIQITTAMGRTWIVETDPGLQMASELVEPEAPDFMMAPSTLQSMGSQSTKPILSVSPAKAIQIPATDPSQTVDVVLGYTSGFAARLGGASQAVTRLNHLVQIANQAYADSQVDGRIRLVGTVQVNYSDATSNQSALFELTGVTCTTSNAGTLRLPDRGQNCSAAPRPAALEPLLQAREDFGVMTQRFLHRSGR